MRSLLAVFIVAAAASAAPGTAVRITILATTDLHGNVFPYDYLTGKASERGLASIATLIQAERKSAPEALLVDAGDTIQGTPLESVYQSGKDPASLKIDPMMLVMNYLHYDAMTVGNHEFNYGLANLLRARSQAKFPWLSANTTVAAGTSTDPFRDYIVKDVKGVKIAIFGLTTPAIPNWEKPENIKGLSWSDPVKVARSLVSRLRSDEHADVVIAVVHGGLESESGSDSEENFVRRLATSVPGIDAVVFGHTHLELPEGRLNGVLITQPKNWGISLARLDIDMNTGQDGHWQVTSKSSRVIPVKGSVPPDPEVLRLIKPYHDATEAWLNEVVGQSPVSLTAVRSRIEDTAVIDAIQLVQLAYAKADVSFAASFNYNASIPRGPVTRRNIASLYVYDNELYAIQGTGKMVREALENAARYFVSCPDPQCRTNLINPKFYGFNYDMAQGVSYEIDLTQPVGKRIRNLQFQGKPLEDARPLRIAVNNYRAGGSGGYTMFRGAPVLWRSYETVRDLMIEYYHTHTIPTTPDNNWRIEPAAARAQLDQLTSKAAASIPSQ